MFITTKDAEIKLVETVLSLQEEGRNWLGAVFHFSRLQEHYKSDYQIKIAVNLINDLLRAYQGGIFVCYDSTMFLVCRNVSDQLLGKIIFQMRYLFMDDPLSYDSEGQENPQFCSAYDLSTRAADFLAICKKKMAESARPDIAADNNEPKAKEFDAFQLLNIERALDGVDVMQAFRRQPVCAMIPDAPARKVFDELYINIAHLRQLLRVGVDLASNRWLFKYLTQLLDEKTISMLRMESKFFDTPVSLNLNVQTLLSNSFADFDNNVHPNTKVAIVIELQVSDVFADMAAFMAAREQVQKQGYRICLDGLSSHSFVQIDREKLGFDLVKLQWNADLKTDLISSYNRELGDAVRRCGSNRVILCRCDNKQAVEYGQEMGISLFQGRYLDSLLNPSSKIEN